MERMKRNRNEGSTVGSARRKCLVALALSIVAALVLLGACSRSYVVAPAGGVPAADTRPLSAVYLIGDFGKPAAPFRDLVAGIDADVATLSGPTFRTGPMILELGDNLYEDGLPHDLGAAGAQDEVDKLRALAEVFAGVRHQGAQVPRSGMST